MNTASPPVIPIRTVVADGVRRQNCVTVRLLALCPMLAVSVSASAAATLGLLTLAVMTVAGFLVAVLAPVTPNAVRLPIFLILVAALVAVSDIAMEAFAFDLHRRLGIFLPLIITNCAVLARLEVFASRQPPLAAAVDGIAVGAGMTAALLMLACARELLGTGGIGDWRMMPFFTGLPTALLPVGGFMLFGLMLAGLRMTGLSKDAF